MRHQDLVDITVTGMALVIGILAVVVFVLLSLSGCTTITAALRPVKERHFVVDDIGNGEGKAIDVRTGLPLFSQNHRLVMWRGEDGVLTVVPEQASSGLSAIEDLPGAAMSHFTWGVAH